MLAPNSFSSGEVTITNTDLLPENKAALCRRLREEHPNKITFSLQLGFLTLEEKRSIDVQINDYFTHVRNSGCAFGRNRMNNIDVELTQLAVNQKAQQELAVVAEVLTMIGYSAKVVLLDLVQTPIHLSNLGNHIPKQITALRLRHPDQLKLRTNIGTDIEIIYADEDKTKFIEAVKKQLSEKSTTQQQICKALRLLWILSAPPPNSVQQHESSKKLSPPHQIGLKLL